MFYVHCFFYSLAHLNTLNVISDISAAYWDGRQSDYGFLFVLYGLLLVVYSGFCRREKHGLIWSPSRSGGGGI